MTHDTVVRPTGRPHGPRTVAADTVISIVQRDITQLDARLAALEVDMSVDMLHGLSDAADIEHYGRAHAEHARLTDRLSAAQDALRQLLS